MADLVLDTLLIKLRGDLSELQGDIGKMQSEFRTGFANIQRDAQRSGRSTAQSFNAIAPAAALAKTNISSIGTAAVTAGQSVAVGMRSIAGSLGIAFGTAAVINFGKSIVELGGKLTDLAAQTGFSAQLLSGLKSVLEENGATIDAFARGIFIAQKSLGDAQADTAGAAAAAKLLGLNLQELQSLPTEQFFDKIATALSRVENTQLRAAIGSDLLGRSYRELAPVINQVAGRLDEFRKQGISEQDIRSLDEFGDAWTRLSNQITATAAGPLARWLDNVRMFWLGLTPNETLLLKLGELENKFSKVSDQLERAQRATNGSFFDKLFGQQFNLSTFSFEPKAGNIDALQKQRDDLLKQINEAAAKINELNKPKPEGAPGPKLGGDAAKIKSFTEGLEKQIIALRGETIALNQGEEAALRFKLIQEAMAVVGKNIPPAIKKQIDSIISLSSAIAQLRVEEEALNSAFEASEIKAKESADAFTTIRESLRSIDLASLSEGAKAFADSDKQFDDLTLAITRAADALQRLGELTPAKAKEIQSALENADFLKRQARLKIDAASGGRPDLIAFDVLDKEQGDSLQEAAQSTANVGKAIEDLRARMIGINTESTLFGNRFDSVSASIDATKTAIKSLIGEGLGALDPAIQRLNDQLKNLEGIQEMRESFLTLFDAIANGIDETLRGMLQGTQSFGEAMKNLARNILLSISNEINKTFILKPLREAFQSLLPQAPGAGGVAGAVSQAQPAVALTTAGTSLSGSAVSLTTAATALSAAAAALAGVSIPGALGGLVPNIKEFPNIAAPPLEMPEIPDISEWKFELTEGATDLFDSLSESMSTGLQNIATNSSSGFSQLFSSLGSMISEGLSSLGNMGSGGGGGFDWSGMATSAISWIGSLLMFLEKGGPVKALPRFDSGGEVPAILHQGEFVIRKSAVDLVGVPTLEKMNRGLAIPRLDFGGLISTMPHINPSLLSVPRRYDNGGMVGPSLGKMSSAQMSNKFAVEVKVLGDITPKQPGMTKDEVIQVIIKDFSGRGPAMQIMEQRTSKGG